MPSLRAFVDTRLDLLAKCPGMWCSTKEAFLCTVSLLMELGGAVQKDRQGPEGLEAYRRVFKFVGAKAGAPVDESILREGLTDEWAREVIAWAKEQLPKIAPKDEESLG